MQLSDRDGQSGINASTEKLEKDEDSTSRTFSEDSSGSDFLSIPLSPAGLVKEETDDARKDICWSSMSPTEKEGSKKKQDEDHNGGVNVHAAHDSCNDGDTAPLLVLQEPQERLPRRRLRWHASVDEDLERRRVWHLTHPPRIQNGRRVKALVTVAQKLEAVIQLKHINEDADDGNLSSSSSEGEGENLDTEDEISVTEHDVYHEDAATAMLRISGAHSKECCHNTGPLLLPALMASYKERILLTRQAKRLSKLRAKRRVMRRQVRTERTKRQSDLATAAVCIARQWHRQGKQKRNTLASLAYAALEVIKIQNRFKLLRAVVIAANERTQRLTRLPKDAAKVARQWRLKRNKRNNTVNGDIWEHQRKIQIKAALARAAAEALNTRRRATLLQALLEAVEKRRIRKRCLEHVPSLKVSSLDEIPVEISVPSDMASSCDGFDDHRLLEFHPPPELVFAKSSRRY